MNRHTKRLGRLAAAIAAALNRPETRMLPPLPEQVWADAQRQHRQLTRAGWRRWSGAERRTADRLLAALVHLRAELARFDHALPPVSRQRRCRGGDVLGDLVALETEFPEVEPFASASTIGVVTDPITLEGVELGRFRVELDWTRLRGVHQPYSVTALDPHPSCANSEVVHPHVSEERLCEGEGHAPIRAALGGGRLYDFFLLVRQVLETYNRASAYVALSEWEGIRCLDCGDWAGEEDRTACERCGADLCWQCAGECEACGRVGCCACRDLCTRCEAACCRRCLSDHDTGRLCESCVEELTKQDQGDPNADQAPQPNIKTSGDPADALGVGQADVRA